MPLWQWKGNVQIDSVIAALGNKLAILQTFCLIQYITLCLYLCISSQRGVSALRLREENGCRIYGYTFRVTPLELRLKTVAQDSCVCVYVCDCPGSPQKLQRWERWG